MATKSKAYNDGYRDGLNWDLDGYESYEAAASDGGWSYATITAVGSSECARVWGVPKSKIGRSAQWDTACREYDRGVHDAISSPHHAGLPPSA